MGKRIEMWKYFGLKKNDVLQFKGTVSLDNLLALKTQCLAVAVISFIMGPVFLVLTPESIKGYILILCSIFFISLYTTASHTIKYSEKVPVAYADVLIFTFSLALFLVCLYVGTLGSYGFPAVTLVAMLLFIQVDFDTLPQKNLLTILVAFIIFLICSYYTKDTFVFVTDILDATIGTALGLFVSWLKAKNKWENVIAQGKLRQVNYELYHACITDELTKLPNRRQAFEEIERKCKCCIANGTQLVCIIMDIDHFKEYNDTYGHPQGDILLKKIGEVLLQLSQSLDINAGRIGGEEFMFCWEETNAQRAYTIAEQIRLAIQNIPHPARDKGAVFTVSLGICTKYPVAGYDVEDAYREADDAMYHAKRSGKNSCWSYFAETDTYAKI